MTPDQSTDIAGLLPNADHEQPPAPASTGLEALYLVLREELGRFLRARTGSEDEAREILQDLWLKLRVPGTGPIAHPRAYLYRMAQNLVLDRRREQHRRARREQLWQDEVLDRPEDGRDVVDQRSDPEREIVEREERARLMSAIDALPEGARRAFQLHKISGLTHAQVAEVLGISKSGVEKHMAVAMNHLRRLLDD